MKQANQIQVSTIAKPRAMYGKLFTENTLKANASNTSNWIPRQPKITEKTLFSHSFEAFSDRSYFEFVSFSSNGEFVAPSSDTLAIVFLQGGNGKKVSDASMDRSGEIQIAQWTDKGRNGSYRLADGRGEQLYAEVGCGKWDRVWNQVTVYVIYTYDMDIKNNGEPSSFVRYKTMLGGHSNRGGVKRQLHLTNKIKHGHGEYLMIMDIQV